MKKEKLLSLMTKVVVEDVGHLVQQLQLKVWMSFLVIQISLESTQFNNFWTVTKMDTVVMEGGCMKGLNMLVSMVFCLKKIIHISIDIQIEDAKKIKSISMKKLF